MMPDHAFLRTDVPMTKQEVRAVTLAKLELAPHHRALDIGAGTGSVTVEMALRCREVVAIEKDPEALALLRENVKRFSLTNVRIVEGTAPQALAGLGHFDSIFIGGSGEELGELLRQIPHHAQGRVVANAICIDTMAQVMEAFRSAPYLGWEIAEVQVARGLPAGKKIRMAALSPVWVMSATLPTPPAPGSICGLGVGPGDPELLTLKGVRALSRATLVLTPRSSDETASVALGIARRFVPVSCDIAECTFPMSEEKAITDKAWSDAAQRLLACARAGGHAVFLTLGDSTLYSTWGYVLRKIQAECEDLSVETIPGITAISACAARVGVPLAEGRSPLVVWPGKIPEEIPIANAHMVIMKAGRNLRDIAAKTQRWERSAIAISNCGQSGEQIVRDAAQFGDDAGYFTTVLVGPQKS